MGYKDIYNEGNEEENENEVLDILISAVEQ